MSTKDVLSASDRAILNAQTNKDWIPKNPAELILPFVEEVPKINNKDIDARRQKAQEVFKEYTNIIDKCKRLEDQIAEKSKDVKIILTSAKHLQVIEAIKRTFVGIENPYEITFEMYKTILQKMSDSSDKQIDRPETI